MIIRSANCSFSLPFISGYYKSTRYPELILGDPSSLKPATPLSYENRARTSALRRAVDFWQSESGRKRRLEERLAAILAVSTLMRRVVH